jgi:hypothetical protein
LSEDPQPFLLRLRNETKTIFQRHSQPFVENGNYSDSRSFRGFLGLTLEFGKLLTSAVHTRTTTRKNHLWTNEKTSSSQLEMRRKNKHNGSNKLDMPPPPPKKPKTENYEGPTKQHFTPELEAFLLAKEARARARVLDPLGGEDEVMRTSDLLAPNDNSFTLRRDFSSSSTPMLTPLTEEPSDDDEDDQLQNDDLSESRLSGDEFSDLQIRIPSSASSSSSSSTPSWVTPPIAVSPVKSSILRSRDDHKTSANSSASIEVNIRRPQEEQKRSVTLQRRTRPDWSPEEIDTQNSFRFKSTILVNDLVERLELVYQGQGKIFDKRLEFEEEERAFWEFYFMLKHHECAFHTARVASVIR